MILSALRRVMAKTGINIYVLPRTDQYQSEFLTKSDERVAFLSGFTGSNALSIVSEKEALLWTDSRYYMQAKSQLKQPWRMMPMEKDQPKWFQHVIKNYKQQEIIGIDGKLITHQNGKERLKYFENKGYKLKFLQSNLIDQIWDERPKQQYKKIFVHEQYAGTPALQKIRWIREKMKEKQAGGCLITDLSEICWILNIRSSQIPYNPFMKSSLYIGEEVNHLYLPAEHPQYLQTSCEVLSHLDKTNTKLMKFPINFQAFSQNILSKNNNYYVQQRIKNPIAWEGISLQRARRPKKQQDGFINSHIRDGVAMALFWSKRSTKDYIGEYQAAQMIDNQRKKQNLNQGLSFETISAGGPNGAIVHYRPNKQKDFIITKDMIHLVDSGGQYLDGTTDVTRAFHFGQPSKQQKEAYTRVLLGNLDIQRLKWPRNFGIKGCHIDILARRRLWQKGLNYGHGTGHGVGYFQGVHEGPVGISHLNNTVLQQGMITSNQPGYYKEGGFGIRIQNLLMVVSESCEGDYLGFFNLTVCPYDNKLIQMSLLSDDDISFVNRYHSRCWNTLSPLISDRNCLEWLKKATAELKR